MIFHFHLQIVFTTILEKGSIQVYTKDIGRDNYFALTLLIINYSAGIGLRSELALLIIKSCISLAN